MAIGGKDAFLSKVTFRRESNWYSKTKQELKNMTTIEEREDNFAKKEIPNNNGTALWRSGYREGLKVGYHFGATEQREIDDKVAFEEREKAFKAGYDTAIDKACEWLYEHAKAYGEADGLDAVYLYDKEMLVRHFRKAMED